MKNDNSSIDSSSEVMNRIEFFQSQKVIFEMMNDRGYDTSKTELYPEDKFDEISNDDIILTFSHGIGNTFISPIAVVWSAPNASIVGVTVAQNLSQREEKIIILIVPVNTAGRANISAAAKSAISYLDKRIQVFCVKDLMINITKHCLVPKHELISDDEIECLQKVYGSIKKFNGICLTDPVVRYYGWKRGNVIKITRKGNRIIYRIVT